MSSGCEKDGESDKKVWEKKGDGRGRRRGKEEKKEMAEIKGMAAKGEKGAAGRAAGVSVVSGRWCGEVEGVEKEERCKENKKVSKSERGKTQYAPQPLQT